MTTDGDIVRDLANVPTDHHDRCNTRDGRECDCYMTYWQPFLAALARLEAAEAQRDTLAEALRRHEIGDQEVLQILDALDGEISHMVYRGTWATSRSEVEQLLVPTRRKANGLRAALAEAGLE